MPNKQIYDHAPVGFAPYALIKALDSSYPYLWIVEDAVAAEQLRSHLNFFHPSLRSVYIPAWNCLPYDRISPSGDICALRMAALSEIDNETHIIITTVNGCLQRLPPLDFVKGRCLSLRCGDSVSLADVINFASNLSYERVVTVRSAGQYSVRGSLLDIFPSGSDSPYRLDFFGDEIEKIRLFDSLSQLSYGEVDNLHLRASREVVLDESSVDNFCRNYVSYFGESSERDSLYQSISAGIYFPSMEHWLSFFYDGLQTVFDYAGGVIYGDSVLSLFDLRLEMVRDHYSARLSALDSVSVSDNVIDIYRPVSLDSLYLSDGEWRGNLSCRDCIEYSSFASPSASESLGGKSVETFASERVRSDMSVFESLRLRIESYGGKRVIIFCQSSNSLYRLQNLLLEHGLGSYPEIAYFSDMAKHEGHRAFVCVLDLLSGFTCDDFVCFTESDIFGEKLRAGHSAKRLRKRAGESFIREAEALNIGDLAVHEEHGVGRFEGLETLSADGIVHECALLCYADSAKLYVPVENIEVLSRYGGEDSNQALDNLGQAAWQARKAKVKKRLKDMTEKLIAKAAERELCSMPSMFAEGGEYDEFCAGFAYNETDDQLSAIADVLGDLAEGKPMDRLICGDTGFGKTEVALRASFINAHQGGQTAIIAPTTLLVRQHAMNFINRFKPFAVNVKMLSRLCSQKEKLQVKQGLKDGSIDIVIGTHALLHKNISFKNLTLAIIDEEQHFGVKQKQNLKEHAKNIHILTLTATPIPRTLQMAVHGIQNMSIIATPPIDRLAVHTFVCPYDKITIRDAILRERLQNGQFFAVVPRISDLRRTEQILLETLPDLKLIKAHGQLSGEQLETIMSDFINGQYEGLLSTQIIESGIDIPNANTMFIFRPEMFSLAQLYQLRGRIGRSNRRGYCYMMSATDKILTKNAHKRLEIMQTLDSVGAGFSLASYDLDIRGAGNLLGEEQSGHIREVGVELFQKLLRQAVIQAKKQIQENSQANTTTNEAQIDEFSPILSLGVKILIPNKYIDDFNLRLHFYRRLAGLNDTNEIKNLADELIDRFGKLPPEIKVLLAVTEIKINCKHAGIAKVSAFDNGASLHFHNNSFANPKGLIEFLHNNQSNIKLNADHSISLTRRWQKINNRLQGLKNITSELAQIAKCQKYIDSIH